MKATVSDWLVGLSRGQKRLVQLAADAALIVLSLFLAMALRFDGFRVLSRVGVLADLLKVSGLLIPASLVIFIWLGFYRAVIRYISSRAFYTILLGVLASAMVLFLANWLTGANIPRSVPAIYALIALTLIGGVRLSMRAILASHQAKKRSRVIIYGAGASGRQLQMSLISSPEYLPVAFVDDDTSLQGRTISSLPVFSPAILPRIITEYGATRVLLAMPSLPRSARAALLQELGELQIQVQTIPGMADLVSGKTKINEIKDVPVEDLLGRDPVAPNPDLMHHDLRGRVVMVTGAGGSIGSELCHQILNYAPKKLILFELSEFNLYAIDQKLQALIKRQFLPVEVVPILGSVQHFGRLLSVLGEHQVETIYHAAAYKHVPLVEENVVEGIRNNVFGTKTLAEAAVETGVLAFILISTDKAVRPTNVMGASKRLAEMICQSMALRQRGTRFSMVRFGNVLGSSGSVIPLFRQQIAAGGPITVTNPEVTRYFMTIPEAAQLVIQAGAMSRGGDVFVLDMGEPIRIIDLALRMARLSGHNPVIVTDEAASQQSLSANCIEIRITGLRNGEKLYEELLIGDSSAPTSHPRIMTATERALSPEDLDILLELLMQDCVNHDVAAIRKRLIAAQTGYTPESA
ncbi:MAG TPA: nucleoside-diphosphate sugar epimerase/dehydratase [Hyphomonas sp.]|nr:nucleoside-diphosphate sugar epimerase/dehydratase [Hyphomonas sp.]